MAWPAPPPSGPPYRPADDDYSDDMEKELMAIRDRIDDLLRAYRMQRDFRRKTRD